MKILLALLLLTGTSFGEETRQPAKSCTQSIRTESKDLFTQTSCCKVCKKGQACGNSCISWDKTCHQPPGCACQG